MEICYPSNRHFQDLQYRPSVTVEKLKIPCNRSITFARQENTPSLVRVECMFLSNTTLFYLMVEVYLHYYLRCNYMFRFLIIAIFRLYMNP